MVDSYPTSDSRIHGPRARALGCFDGTGLTRGDLYGASLNIVGYETDAAELTANDGGHPAVAGGDGTPAGFRVLASADLFDWAPGGFSAGEVGNRGRCTIGIYIGGTVFSAATTDWHAGLGAPIVAQITRNVLERLSSLDPPSVPSPPTPTELAWDRSH
jgi:hypothetical protein